MDKFIFLSFHCNDSWSNPALHANQMEYIVIKFLYKTSLVAESNISCYYLCINLSDFQFTISTIYLS